MTRSGIVSLLTTADKLLFVLSLLLIVASYVYFWQSSPANYAIVKSEQQAALRIDLGEDRRHFIKGRLGISALEVKQGQIRFIDSPCTNKLCIQSGWHRHGGSITACLPNRISVQLARGDMTPRYDAIIF